MAGPWSPPPLQGALPPGPPPPTRRPAFGGGGRGDPDSYPKVCAEAAGRCWQAGLAAVLERVLTSVLC